jgi:hypothetical protein
MQMQQSFSQWHAAAYLGAAAPVWTDDVRQCYVEFLHAPGVHCGERPEANVSSR